jgi:hypothetical protein
MHKIKLQTFLHLFFKEEAVSVFSTPNHQSSKLTTFVQVTIPLIHNMRMKLVQP